MKILTLSGSCLERGRAHGECLRDEIREQLEWFRGLLSEHGHVNPDEVFARLPNLGWVEAIEKWIPWLLEEVRGIAEGARLPTMDLLSWNLCQEVFWAVFVEHSFPQLESGPTGCSALGDIGDSENPTILAQNADTVAFWHGHQTVLRFREVGSDVEQVMLSYPGMIGIYGLNSKGIGLCVNALFYKLANSLRGLGTIFMGRGILAQRSYQEAETFLRTAPHASGNTLTIGGPGHVTAFEVSANQVRPFLSPSQPGRTYHTNHELVNDDYRPGVDTTPWPNSVERFNLLEERMEKVKGRLTVQDVKTILSTHTEKVRLCRHEDDPDGSMTTYSVVMECSSHPVMHIAFGPPCRERYQKLFPE
jgi:isopenicillin-N N-acyltransferase-like protein